MEAIPQGSRLALLMHGHLKSRNGKMGFGLLRYGSHEIVAVIDRERVGESIRALTNIDCDDIPVVGSVADAAALGADTLVLAIATSGGVLPPDFRVEILDGLRLGMSLVNGLHGSYAADPDFASALQPGRTIFDVRLEPTGLRPGRGRAAAVSARRVVTVGTDMAIGKMTASLELHRAAMERGLRSKFLATGQIGICIAGEGVPLDAVRIDFASGSIERMVRQAGDEYDVLWIEGQGSILHPSSTAWLPLLRGSMATDLILVHRAGQTTIDELPAFPIPPLREVIALYETLARSGGGFPAAKVGGIALNCGHLAGSREAAAACAEVADETGLPCVDVVREGAGRLLDALNVARR